jgi:polysaccharide chain length determinant protein (PEP-CTERM system associated)
MASQISDRASAPAPNEPPLSVPRRPLDVEDYIDIVRRHRSWILGPAFLGLVAGVVTAFMWPDSYLSSGQIRVVPPVVPSRLVQANVSVEMTQRINQLYQEIISRPVLTNLIQTYNLYPFDRKRYPTEDVVESMRKDIHITQPRGLQSRDRSGAAFMISYTYSDRRLAQKVCEELIGKFMSEGSSQRTQQSQLTTQFLKDQFEQAKRELDDVDSRITALRTSNRAQLPEQEQAMIARITSLEQSVQNLNNGISRAGQEKLALETQLRILRDQQASSAASQSDGTPNAPAAARAPMRLRSAELDEVEREINRLEGTLSAMRENYTDSHPDVVRLSAMLNAKRKQREQIMLNLEANRASIESAARQSSASARDPRAALDLTAQIARVQSAIQAKDVEMEDLRQQVMDTQKKARELQIRIDSSPAAQQEYLQLLRDREGISRRYDSMSQRLRDSAMATDLESRNQGETLEILEPANLPSEPYAPNRLVIVAAGFAIGIMLGAGMAAGREIKDNSLKNLKDVRAYTKLTVLGSIPLLENDFVIRRRRRMGWLAWSAALMLGILLMSGSMIYYYTSKA